MEYGGGSGQADEEEKQLKTDLWWAVERAESDIRLTNGRTRS